MAKKGLLAPLLLLISSVSREEVHLNVALNSSGQVETGFFCFLTERSLPDFLLTTIIGTEWPRTISKHQTPAGFSAIWPPSSRLKLFYSLTICWNRKKPKSFQKLPKKWPQQFLLESEVFQHGPKSHQIFWLLFMKIFRQELLKIAQSGHAGHIVLTIDHLNVLPLRTYLGTC